MRGRPTVRTTVARGFMAAAIAVVGIVGLACEGDTGGGVGTHDGACKDVGSTQVRSDHTMWKCEPGDPGDYPNGTWVRTE